MENEAIEAKLTEPRGHPRSGRPRSAQPSSTELQSVESQLVDRAQRGDARAFDDLIRLHQQVAFRVAYLITGSVAAAEESAQEAFVKAWRSLSRFRTGSAFRPWLLTIVGNEAKNHRRSSARRVLREHRVSVPDLDERTPADVAVTADQQRRVWAAVDRLEEAERQVVVCRYFLDLSELETAAVLGIPKGTAKSRLHRAHRRLEALLEIEGAQA